MRMTGKFVGIATVLLAFGTFFSATAQIATSADTSTAAPEAYCTSTGGVVESRIPVYGTNGPIGSWLPLENSRNFASTLRHQMARASTF